MKRKITIPSTDVIDTEVELDEAGTHVLQSPRHISLAQLQEELERLETSARNNGIVGSLLCAKHHVRRRCGGCPVAQSTGIHEYCIHQEFNYTQYRLLLTEVLWELEPNE